jgi:hypothetical protein
MSARILALVAATLATAVTPATSQQPLEPSAAKSVITTLAGRWSFQMFRRGREHPFGKGVREMQLMGDSLKLSWTERFEGSSETTAGFLGYDEPYESFYLVAVRSDRSTPLFLRGSATDNTIRFDPEQTAGSYGNVPGTYIVSELRILDADRFEWVAVNGDWWVAFERVSAL